MNSTDDYETQFAKLMDKFGKDPGCWIKEDHTKQSPAPQDSDFKHALLKAMSEKPIQKPVEHPGFIIWKELEERCCKQSAVAKKMGVSKTAFNELLQGKRNVSVDMALKLELFLKIEAEYWLKLQSDYDLYELRKLRQG